MASNLSRYALDCFYGEMVLTFTGSSSLSLFMYFSLFLSASARGNSVTKEVDVGSAALLSTTLASLSESKFLIGFY
jgi:hypothetical protein